MTLRMIQGTLRALLIDPHSWETDSFQVSVFGEHTALQVGRPKHHTLTLVPDALLPPAHSLFASLCFRTRGDFTRPCTVA